MTNSADMNNNPRRHVAAGRSSGPAPVRVHHRPAILALLFALFAIGIESLTASSSSSCSTDDSGVRISTQEELGAEFNSVPCKNKERLPAVRALFDRMGAQAAEISVEKVGGTENLVLIKRGASDERIVIGAHYDKVDPGCGAIDNWTGIVTIAHLYRSLANWKSTKTLVFVAFGKEEEGLVGSKAMASRLDKAQAAQYCAMVNIDSLGLAAAQVADNMSSKKLLDLAESLAKEMQMPFSHTSIPGAATDSVPFVDKKIPAIEIHGMSNDWKSVLHSDKDQVSRVKPVSVYLGYRLALSIVYRIDGMPCAAFR
jgi:hypothetical protein